MIVVSDSSPLIVLAKIDCFQLLEKLFGRITISLEVFAEVTTAGTAFAGAIETSTSPWIDVRHIKNSADLRTAQARLGLGIGELSTIILAKEIEADLLIFDDLGARKLAQREGFKVQGCIGILEASFRKGHLADLREAYKRMLTHKVYLDRQLLNTSLSSFNLPIL